MSKETGGPAFPANGHPGQQHIQQEGMSLRDHFAALAMQGWLASYSGEESHPVASGYEDMVASNAYKLADAMIRARSE